MNPSVLTLRQKIERKAKHCHLFVLPTGYHLQSSYQGKVHAETVPFDHSDKDDDKIIKKFEMAFGLTKKKAADAKPKKRQTKPAKDDSVDAGS